MLAKPG
jgi:catechol 2,3-dioxygenase-like lactoylglutathione lyase family enzyme